MVDLLICLFQVPLKSLMVVQTEVSIMDGRTFCSSVVSSAAYIAPFAALFDVLC